MATKGQIQNTAQTAAQNATQNTQPYQEILKGFMTAYNDAKPDTPLTDADLQYGNKNLNNAINSAFKKNSCIVVGAPLPVDAEEAYRGAIKDYIKPFFVDSKYSVERRTGKDRFNKASNYSYMVQMLVRFTDGFSENASKQTYQVFETVTVEGSEYHHAELTPDSLREVEEISPEAKGEVRTRLQEINSRINSPDEKRAILQCLLDADGPLKKAVSEVFRRAQAAGADISKDVLINIHPHTLLVYYSPTIEFEVNSTGIAPKERVIVRLDTQAVAVTDIADKKCDCFASYEDRRLILNIVPVGLAPEGAFAISSEMGTSAKVQIVAAKKTAEATAADCPGFVSQNVQKSQMDEGTLDLMRRIVKERLPLAVPLNSDYLLSDGIVFDIYQQKREAKKYNAILEAKETKKLPDCRIMKCPICEKRFFSDAEDKKGTNESPSTSKDKDEEKSLAEFASDILGRQPIGSWCNACANEYEEKEKEKKSEFKKYTEDIVKDANDNKKKRKGALATYKKEEEKKNKVDKHFGKDAEAAALDAWKDVRNALLGALRMYLPKKTREDADEDPMKISIELLSTDPVTVQVEGMKFLVMGKGGAEPPKTAEDGYSYLAVDKVPWGKMKYYYLGKKD